MFDQCVIKKSARITSQICRQCIKVVQDLFLVSSSSIMRASCCMTIQHPTSWCLTSNLPKNQRSQQRIDLQSTATSSKWPQAHDWLRLSVSQQRLADPKNHRSQIRSQTRHLTIWYHLQVGDVFLSNIYWELLKNDAFPRMSFVLDRSKLLWGSYHFPKQSHDGCLQASEDVFHPNLPVNYRWSASFVWLWWCFGVWNGMRNLLHASVECGNARLIMGPNLLLGAMARNLSEVSANVDSCLSCCSNQGHEKTAPLYENIGFKMSNPFCQPFVKLPVVPHKAVAEVSKNRKRIGEIDCCEWRMSEQKHWPTD